MSSPLTPFSYEVLALVGNGGAGAHDIKRMARKGRIWAWAGESQYYTEPKRLAALGYLSARVEPGKTRPRTVYELTAAGREALAAWARTPARFPSLRHEVTVRLLAADLVGEETVLEGLAGLEEQIDEIEASFERGLADADVNLPHRRKYLRLSARFGRRWLQLNREWLAELRRELTDGAPGKHERDRPDSE
jgi:DNA-binding PadR family transcriptional regulator